MKISKVILVTMVALLAVSVAACGKKGSLKRNSTIMGTGSQLGVYYSAGLGIADINNEYGDGIKVAIDATEGSIYNIAALGMGEIDLAIAQADHFYHAVEGRKFWKGDPQKNLRFVCSLHTEAITVITSEDSNIEELSDLRYKRVNIGTPLSGTRQNAIDVLNILGIDEKIDITAEGDTPDVAAVMLKEGTIDALFFTAGHPNAFISEALSGEKIMRFVEMEGLDKMLKAFPYYAPTMISMSHYPQASNEDDIETIGVLAVVLANADTDEDAVYEITKALFENLTEFKAKHPSFVDITKPGMLEGNFSDIHPGAMRYYEEMGLLD